MGSRVCQIQGRPCSLMLTSLLQGFSGRLILDLSHSSKASEAQKTTSKEIGEREFPGDPVANTQHFHPRDPGLIPGCGTHISQAPGHGQKKKKRKHGSIIGYSNSTSGHLPQTVESRTLKTCLYPYDHRSVIHKNHRKNHPKCPLTNE